MRRASGVQRRWSSAAQGSSKRFAQIASFGNRLVQESHESCRSTDVDVVAHCHDCAGPGRHDFLRQGDTGRTGLILGWLRGVPRNKRRSARVHDQNRYAPAAERLSDLLPCNWRGADRLIRGFRRSDNLANAMHRAPVSNRRDHQNAPRGTAFLPRLPILRTSSSRSKVGGRSTSNRSRLMP